MSYLLQAGFDMFGAQANGALPVHNAGLAGTPYAALLTPIALNTGCAVGVSGLETHKFGTDTTLRNALVCYRQANSNSSGAYVQPIRAWRAGNGAWSRTIQFSFKNLSARDNDVASTSILAMGNAQGSVSLNLFGLTTTKRLLLCGAALDVALFTIERFRDYHVELRMWRTAEMAINQINFDLYIDGTFLATRVAAPIALASSDLYFSLGSPPNTSTSYHQIFLIADLVVSDLDKPVGPVRILPVTVASVGPTNGWAKEGNATPAQTLSDNSDATYFTSPESSGALNVKVGLGENPQLPLLGVSLYVRSNRDRDAGRAMVAQLTSEAGVDIGAPVTIPNTATFALAPAGNYTRPDSGNVPLPTVGDLAKASLRINAVVP